MTEVLPCQIFPLIPGTMNACTGQRVAFRENTGVVNFPIMTFWDPESWKATTLNQPGELCSNLATSHGFRTTPSTRTSYFRLQVLLLLLEKQYDSFQERQDLW